ncbi:MAG: hypothetical protein LC722_04840 [Actinobacteria bacterium]|nr:hypothetical protein [Actinomycetota bacterium]
MRRGKYQGVTAYVGMPGSGKTYGLAQQADRALRRGSIVYSNAGFEVVGSRVLHDWQDFAELVQESEDGCRKLAAVYPSRSDVCEHGYPWLEVVVVWDELPLYFNARRWTDFPDGMLYQLTQVRKVGIRLYYSAIHEEMVDVTLRRLTFWFWHCRAVTGRVLRRSLYPPDQFRKAKTKPYRREWVFVRESVAALYDTTRKVELPERVRSRYGARSGGGQKGSQGGSGAAGGSPVGGPAGPGVLEVPRAPEDVSLADLLAQDGERVFGGSERPTP